MPTLRTHLGRVLLALLLSFAAASACRIVDGPDRTTPIDLAPSAESDEQRLERVLLALLDGEALYTVAGGLKPVSSGFWSANIELAHPDLGEVARMQRMLRGLRGVDDEVEFGVTSFAKEHDGTRAIQAWVAHRSAVARALERHADFFAPLGVGPHLECDEVLAIVERLPRLARFRGYGYLFGYPDYAVEFFVSAAAEEDRTGTLPAREFEHVPTHGAEQHRFVWAAPSGHVENDVDRELRRRAAPVLERYRALRQRYVGAGQPGAEALLRAASRLRPPTARTTSTPLTSSTP